MIPAMLPLCGHNLFFLQYFQNLSSNATISLCLSAAAFSPGYHSRLFDSIQRKHFKTQVKAIPLKLFVKYQWKMRDCASEEDLSY